MRFPRITTGRVILALVIAAAGGLAVRAAFFGGPKIAYDTHEVMRGTLRQTVEVTGEVISSADVDLRFESSGRLKAVAVKVGDAVEAGDVLASLDDRNERVRVQSAQAALQSAQASLDRLLKGATAEDLRVAEVAVENAGIALEQARGSLADTEASNAASLDKAYADLDGAVETLSLKASAALQIMRSDVFDAAGNVRNDFYTSDAGALAQAQHAFRAAQADLARMGADVPAYRAAPSSAKADLAGTILVEGRAVRTAAQLANDVMQASSPLGATTQAAFDTRKANVKAAWTDLNLAVNAAESQKLLVASTVAAGNASANAASQAVRAAEGALESAKASLAFKKAPATSYDIAAARASVTQAVASLGEANLARDRAAIRAPFDGTVASVLGRAGSTVTAADVILKLHGEDVYEVEADVPETDISKLREGMKAGMWLDAYGEDAVFEAELTSIDAAQTVIQDVVYYKTRFRFAARDLPVRTGMTASVTIVAVERPDALIVPQRSIREDEDGAKYVRVLVDGADARRPVTLGARGDDGLVEVLSGLSGGEPVILAIRENGEVKR